MRLDANQVPPRMGAVMFAKPAVGTTVSVTTRYQTAYYKRTSDFVDHVYTNVPVLRSQKFDPPNTFRIPAANEPYITERVIALHNVVELTIGGVSTDSDQPDTGVEYITVSGSKGNEYVVTVTNGVPTSCTCPGYQFRRTCKHVQSTKR